MSALTRVFRPFVLLAAALPAVLAQSATISTEEMQAAGYSRATNKVVLLPDRAGSLNLTLYSPATGLETITLPGSGEQLAVNASGTLAAVKHSNGISVVNLVNRTVVRTFGPLPGLGDTGKLAIGEEWVYLTGAGSFHILTGMIMPHTFDGVYRARLLPNGSALFACTYNYQLIRIDTSTGPMVDSRTLPSDGSCGADMMSISGDGTKLYTDYGRVRTISNNPADDLKYLTEIADSIYLSNVYDPGTGKAAMIRGGATSVLDTATMRVLNTYFTSGYPLGSFLDTSGNGLLLVTTNRVTRMDLQMASTTCFASFYEDQYNPATREVTGSGAIVSYQLEGSTPDCQYQLTSSANWVEMVQSVDGRTGGPRSTVFVVVRPNLTGAPRTATLRVGSQSLILTQAALTRTQMQRISVNVQDAEFNRTNNTLVSVSKSPDELHIYDPVSGTTQFVRLGSTPLSVAVQPDGRFAAVGHAGSITLVSLEARAIVQQMTIPYPAQDIVLPGNGYIYAFASRQNWGYYNLSTNTWTFVNSPLANSYAKLNAPLRAIYVNGEKWSIANGVPVKVDIPASTACPFTSISEAGDLRIGCATIAEASNDPAREGVVVANDQSYLSGPWEHSSAARMFVTAGGLQGQIRVIADRTGASVATLAVPGFDGFSMASTKLAFWNREGTRIYTVSHGFMLPDLNFTNHVVIGEFALPGTCPLTLSQSQVSVPESGATGQITIATQPGCSFAPGPVPNWIRTTTQSTTSFQYQVLQNDTTQIRSYALTVGSKTILFTQAPSTGVVTFSPSSLTFAQGVTSLPLTIQTSRPDLQWSMINLTPDVIRTDNTSSIGTQTITLTLRSNTANSARTGVLLVNGVRLTVTQAGINGALTGARPVTILNAKGDPVAVTVGNSAGVLPDNSQVDSRWIRTEIASPTQLLVSATENLTTRYRTGYFVADGQRYQVTQSPASQLVYYPIAPCRLVDTRVVNSPFGGPFLPAGVPRTFQMHGGPCGIDPAATAFALNITAVPRGPLGYLTAYPAGTERPNTSVLNSLDGRVKAAFTVVNAGTPGGGISLFANSDTDVVVDVAGYFAPQSGPGLLFYPVTPCRVTDTRTSSTTLRAGAAQSIEVAGKCGVPSTARVVSMNATAIPKTTLGYLQVWPTGQAQPSVSTLNATTGTITANALFAPTGTDGKVDVFANNDTDLLLDVNGYFDYPGGGFTQAYTYYRVEPCRMSDTRDTRVELSPANAYREIAGAGVCGLPGNTYSLMNVTAIPSGPLGYLTVWGTGDRPPVSTLNAVDGQITSNAAIIEQQGFPGNFRVFGSGATHVFFDLTGYFSRLQ